MEIQIPCLGGPKDGETVTVDTDTDNFKVLKESGLHPGYANDLLLIVGWYYLFESWDTGELTYELRYSYSDPYAGSSSD